MLIIGEKINGTRPGVARAISGRDKDMIRDLAKKQQDAGAHFLDVNAGTRPEEEPEALGWLVETVQQSVTIPLCLDSANPKAIAAAIKSVNQTPMINSISGEKERIEKILPIVAEHGCKVIALAMDDSGIPKTSEDRLAVIDRLIGETDKAGVGRDQVYIDPLVMAVATDTKSGLMAFEVMRNTKARHPGVHLTSGLSNISFGMPARKLINRVFLTLALEAGLDSAIMDPMDRELREALLASQVVLGRDDYCINFTRAYRAGEIGTALEKRPQKK